MHVVQGPISQCVKDIRKNDKIYFNNMHINNNVNKTQIRYLNGKKIHEESN